MPTEDLPAFLADFGQDCVFGAYSFKGLFDTPDSATLLEPAHVHTREYSLRYISAQAVLTRGLAGTVAGVAYAVRGAPQALADGAFSTVLLTKT